jgi:hypothetical protein
MYSLVIYMRTLALRFGCNRVFLWGCLSVGAIILF